MMSAATMLSTTGASTQSLNGATEPKIRDAAQQFESFLIKQMLRELRASVLSEPQSGSSQAYREMSDDLMAEHLAKSGAFGFGKAMADQMLGQIRQASLNTQP